MARMKRILITIDAETLECLKRWRRSKQVPSSEVIRMATKAYTKWREKDLVPAPESFDGIDYDYDNG